MKRKQFLDTPYLLEPTLVEIQSGSRDREEKLLQLIQVCFGCPDGTSSRKGWEGELVRSTPKSYSTNLSHVVEYVGRTGLSPPAGYHNYPWGWVQIKLSNNSRHQTYNTGEHPLPEALWYKSLRGRTWNPHTRDYNSSSSANLTQPSLNYKFHNYPQNKCRT